MNTVPPTAHASPAALGKASLAALGVAGAVLILFVLPAEAGIDPTGAGKAFGIAGMGAAETAETDTTSGPAQSASVAVPTRETIEAKIAWREDVETIELAPHSGIELKTHMAKGDSFVFDWQATGGAVKVDMHGEPPSAAEDEFTSYWIEKEASSQTGTFTAPFDGSHGWYWRNKGDTPVTVKVKVSGFYKDIYRP